MNVRKAQKHMQRARELLEQGQLGFGTGQKRTIQGHFKEQIQGVCFMYAVFTLVLRKLYSDSALSNLKYVQDAKKKMDSGSVLRVGRNTIDKETINLYNSIHEYWSARDTWDLYNDWLKNNPDWKKEIIERCEQKHGIGFLNKKPKLIKKEMSSSDLLEGGSSEHVLEAILLSTEKYNTVAFVKIKLFDTTHMFSTIHCENEEMEVKNHDTMINHKETLNHISESAQYKEVYILVQIERKFMNYEECIETLKEVQPLAHRLAGAFMNMILIEGGHVVAMIPSRHGFEIYDANETQVHSIDHFPYRHEDNCRPIDQITYVFAPSGIIPGQVQETKTWKCNKKRKKQKLGA